MPRVTKAGGGELVVQSVGTAHLQRDGEVRGCDAQHLLVQATLSAAATSPAASRRNRCLAVRLCHLRCDLGRQRGLELGRRRSQCCTHISSSAAQLTAASCPLFSCVARGGTPSTGNKGDVVIVLYNIAAVDA